VMVLTIELTGSMKTPAERAVRRPGLMNGFMVVAGSAGAEADARNVVRRNEALRFGKMCETRSR